MFFHGGFYANEFDLTCGSFRRYPRPAFQARYESASFRHSRRRFLGLLAGQNYLAHIERRAKNHWRTLQKPLRFKRNRPPVATTLSRNLANISLQELQDAFAKFLSQLLENQELTAAVDGKTAKQIKDADGEPLPMLNVFVHDIKVTLAEWSVKGDKTNEPGCLK